MKEGLTSQVYGAFSALAQESGGLVNRFEDAFKERAKIPELNEAKGEQGLTFVLADLLWGPPPETYYDLSNFHQDYLKEAQVNPLFLEQFRMAVENVEARYPHVLLYLGSYQKEQGRPLREILRALIAFYVDSRKALGF